MCLPFRRRLLVTSHACSSWIGHLWQSPVHHTDVDAQLSHGASEGWKHNKPTKEKTWRGVKVSPPGLIIWDVQRSLISELNVLHNNYNKKMVLSTKKSVFCENMKCKFSLLLRDLAVLYSGWKWDGVKKQQMCWVVWWVLSVEGSMLWFCVFFYL